jgi:hypothetical protein
MTELMIGLSAGVVGMAYFVYGKNHTRFAPMLCGILLCMYPYFVDGLLWLCGLGVVLMIIPFLTDF